MSFNVKVLLKKLSLLKQLYAYASTYKQDFLFPGSKTYWESRYAKKGNSGAGSYGEFALFKAEILNSFVQKNDICSVIEFGCGDSNQLSLLSFPHYIGLDVSTTALKLCIQRFEDDQTKSFFLYDSRCFLDHNKIFTAQLALSLDVIYHLVEDDVYFLHLRHLFASATKYVIIYSSDTDEQPKHLSPHCRLRHFRKDVEAHFPQWRWVETVCTPIQTNPAVDFYIYEKI